MPLVAGLHAILFEGRTLNQVIELLMRADARRILVVSPGSLTEQWQDELFFKFGLRFNLLTNQLIDAHVDLNVFETNPAEAAELFNPDRLPGFHDPFAGGGALPLEAQRLGLESHASDLNPVAVTINKAMMFKTNANKANNCWPLAR